MTISSTNRKAGPFTGNGVTVAFPFTFKVFTQADVLVVLTLLSTGAETIQALTTNYTVALNADQNANPGGTITMLVAPPVGYSLTATSQVANLQPMDLTNAGGFYPKVINDAIDRVTILIQQLSEKLGRALTYSVSSPLGDSALPPPVANNVIGWNATANGFQNYAPVDNTLLAAALAAPSGASMSGYMPAGVGASPSDVERKLRENVSFDDFEKPARTVGNLSGVTGDDKAIVYVAGYHAESDGGGGHYSWDASKDKATHNGGAIVDPDKTFPTDWDNAAQKASWYSAGAGLGCWVRRYEAYLDVRVFGVKATNTGDDKEALDACVAYCRSAGNIVSTEGLVIPVFPPNRTIKKTGTLNLIDFRVAVNFNNCRIEQMEAVDSLLIEGNQLNPTKVWINYSSTLSGAAIIAAQCYGIKISGGQAVSVNSETVFSEFKQVWVWGAWRGIGLDASGAFGGLVWQFKLTQCYVIKCYDYQYYFNSVTQVSTTTTLANCHAGCKWVDAVTRGGNTYVSIAHHTSSAATEPGVGASWATYWVLDNYATGATAWATGTFYRTHGKGFYIYNVQTVVMDNCSMDGGDNAASGNVIYALNSHIDINTFHLEGHNLFKLNTTPIQIGSDARIGEIYLYDLRVRLPSGTDSAFLIGGVDSRVRVISIDNVRNHTQNVNAVGVMYGFNGGGGTSQFARVSLGAGMGSAGNLVPGFNSDADSASGLVNSGVALTPFTYFVTNPNSVTKIEVELVAVETNGNYAFVSYKWVFVLINRLGTLTASAINSDLASQIVQSSANYTIAPAISVAIVNGGSAKASVTLTAGGTLGWTQCRYVLRTKVLSNSPAGLFV